MNLTISTAFVYQKLIDDSTKIQYLQSSSQMNTLTFGSGNVAGLPGAIVATTWNTSFGSSCASSVMLNTTQGLVGGNWIVVGVGMGS